MSWCWVGDSAKRPPFSTIVTALRQLPPSNQTSTTHVSSSPKRQGLDDPLKEPLL
eukprot:m.79971 g.79971  ORF g.79971 m.79971 type:complete len:55 (-) comp19337_c0_seq1:118-282(-)